MAGRCRSRSREPGEKAFSRAGTAPPGSPPRRSSPAFRRARRSSSRERPGTCLGAARREVSRSGLWRARHIPGGRGAGGGLRLGAQPGLGRSPRVTRGRIGLIQGPAGFFLRASGPGGSSPGLGVWSSRLIRGDPGLGSGGTRGGSDVAERPGAPRSVPILPRACGTAIPKALFGVIRARKASVSSSKPSGTEGEAEVSLGGGRR